MQREGGDTLGHVPTVGVTVAVGATAVTAEVAVEILAAPPSGAGGDRQATWISDASPDLGQGAALSTGGGDPGRTLGVADHGPDLGIDLDRGHLAIHHVAVDLTTSTCCRHSLYVLANAPCPITGHLPAPLLLAAPPPDLALALAQGHGHDSEASVAAPVSASGAGAGPAPASSPQSCRRSDCEAGLWRR